MADQRQKTSDPEPELEGLDTQETVEAIVTGVLGGGITALTENSSIMLLPITGIAAVAGMFLSRRSKSIHRTRDQRSRDLQESTRIGTMLLTVCVTSVAVKIIMYAVL